MNTTKQINIMIMVVFLAVFATGAYTLWDPGRADDAEDRQLENTIERGAFLFSQNCRTCHGDLGEGGAASNRLRAAPALNTQALAEDASDVEYADRYKFIYYTITCGRVGRVMPSWGQSQGGPLNDEQIRQLTVFLLRGGDDGWREAQHFGVEGVPEFGEFGDNQYALALAADVAEGDTTITLNTVRGAPSATGEPGPVALFPNERLAIDRVTTEEVETGETETNEEGEEVPVTREVEDREVIEIMTILEVNAENNSVAVERGVGNTSPRAHTAGTEVLKPPVPPTDPEPVARSCGQTAGAAGPTATPAPPSATLSIIAQGIAWNTEVLTAFAGQPLTITVDNRDEGEIHNWHLTEGAVSGGDEIPNAGSDVTASELERGPNVQTLDFGPLDLGEYYYYCETHPAMEGVLTALEAGAAQPGASTPGAELPVDQTPTPAP